MSLNQEIVLDLDIRSLNGISSHRAGIPRKFTVSNDCGMSAHTDYLIN